MRPKFILQYLTLLVFILPIGVLIAQDDAPEVQFDYQSKPAHMWELGLHIGNSMSVGDLDGDIPSIGVGLHIRKALDHVFSIRVDGGYYNMSGERENANESYESTYLNGDIGILITLNNLFWKKPSKKVNVYTGGGGGIGKLDVDRMINGNAEKPLDIFSADDLISHAYIPIGLSFKISNRFNFGIEHKIVVPFGKAADLIDGWNNQGQSTTSFRDIIHYTHVRLNFNLGKTNNKTEPLYWVNPNQNMVDDIAELKARPKLDLTDSDSDGVIDMMDQDPTTPSGYPVDTRGVALDSDGDGIPDGMDAEDYSPTGYDIDGNGVAQVPDPNVLDEDDVNRLIDAKLRDYVPKGGTSSSIVDWFLPMIHFGFDRSTIASSEYGKLHHVATVLRNNPGISITVTGHTDKTASNCYNNKLSYQRAANAIQYLVANYGISANRLVLNWSGEESALVNTGSQNKINRRAEFSVSQGESSMGAPDCAGKSPKGYSGNKEGY